MTEYSNPRMQSDIPNWPSGGKRVTAQFYIETHKDKQRAWRITTGKGIKLKFATQMRIVDGDDGKTYIAQLHKEYGFISIMRGDMKLQHETIWPKDGKWEMAIALFEYKQNGG